MPERRVEFYYDFSCPFAYVASTQIEGICQRHGAELDLRPMLLGGVFRHWERPQTPDGGMPAAKARHNLTDMHRWAAYFDVPFRLPATHPMRTVEALRLLLVSPKPSWWTLTQAIYRAYWAGGDDARDIRDTAVLADIASGLGLDGSALVAGIAGADVKAELRRRTDEAIERGVFGVPTFFIDGQKFWGQDRLHFVERALQGERLAGPDRIDHYFGER